MLDSLSGIMAFVQVAETRSFTEAGRLMEISSSAVGKSVSRMEERLGVRLFHRSTRSVTLTAEGELFLARCKRIIQEAEQAEIELSQLADEPRGKLRISVPLQNTLIFPLLTGFMQAYPADRAGRGPVGPHGGRDRRRLRCRGAYRPAVGFAADGAQAGEYKLELVASPDYLARRGRPTHPDQLRDHACLLHKFPASGSLERWPVRDPDADTDPELGRVIACTTTDALTHMALEGLGIACLADFSTIQALRDGHLERVLPEFTDHRGSLWMLWPSSRNATPKLRVLIDYFKQHIATVEQP